MLILLTIIDMTVGTHCNNCTTGGFVVEEHKGDPAVSTPYCSKFNLLL